MNEEWNTMYSSISVPLTLFLGADLLPLVKDMRNAPLVLKMTKLRVSLGFDGIKIIDGKQIIKPTEYMFDSYGKVLLKQSVNFEEAEDKILQSLEKILLSDDGNILEWKNEVAEQEGLKPPTYSVTIDGEKKDTFTIKELTEIFEKGGFNSILLDKGAE
jgi:hypothetical protein